MIKLPAQPTNELLDLMCLDEIGSQVKGYGFMPMGRGAAAEIYRRLVEWSLKNEGQEVPAITRRKADPLKLT